MKVEIWSDVMCPFCYIGKRKFEAALSQFDENNNIEVVWKSFQLAPDLQTSPGKNIHQFLAEHKGMTLAQAKGLNDQVAGMAAQAGLVYNFDKAIPANSFNAHRFVHFAKQHHLQDKAEESLLEAYFTDGKNIDDTDTLVQLGTAIGLDASETKKVLETNQYADNVQKDISEAQQIGVNGVPFFVFDRKYAVSGAQDSNVFSATLEKAFAEWKKNNTSVKLELNEGEACKIGEDC